MKNSVQSMVLALLLHFVWPGEPSFAASFDCAQARTVTEKTICLSPELSALDAQMADAYRAAITTGDADQLRADQRAWIRQRNRCQTAMCLVEAHRARIAALATVRGPAGIPSSVPATSLAQAPAASVPPQGSKPIGTQQAIQACDRLAAHPDDPEAFTQGVTDAQLDAAASANACQRAVLEDPLVPRLRFQLARAYLKSGKFEPAIDELIAASEMGHGAALATLADLHLTGVQGIEVDPALAHSLYEKAVASGFTPAARVLSDFADMTDAFAKAEASDANTSSVLPSPVALKPYAMPNIVENIQSKKLDAIVFDELWVKDYLVNIADNIRAVCEGHFTQQDVERLKAQSGADHFGLGQATVGASLLGAMAALSQAMKDPGAFAAAHASAGDVLNEDAFDVAMKDTEALFQRHSCHTPGLEQFSKNLRAFVGNEQAPLPPEGALMNACMRDPPQSKYGPRDFCLCFGGGLGKARVSQANRNLLAKDFKSAAVAIMTIDRNVPQFQSCRSGF
jgi:uncharacterized protein